MGFPGGLDGKDSACNVGDTGLIPGSGRTLGEGNDNPLQHSCLGNPHRQRNLEGYSPWVTKWQSRLSDLTATEEVGHADLQWRCPELKGWMNRVAEELWGRTRRESQAVSMCCLSGALYVLFSSCISNKLEECFDMPSHPPQSSSVTQHLTQSTEHIN